MIFQRSVVCYQPNSIWSLCITVLHFAVVVGVFWLFILPAIKSVCSFGSHRISCFSIIYSICELKISVILHMSNLAAMCLQKKNQPKFLVFFFIIKLFVACPRGHYVLCLIFAMLFVLNGAEEKVTQRICISAMNKFKWRSNFSTVKKLKVILGWHMQFKLERFRQINCYNGKITALLGAPSCSSGMLGSRLVEEHVLLCIGQQGANNLVVYRLFSCLCFSQSLNGRCVWHKRYSTHMRHDQDNQATILIQEQFINAINHSWAPLVDH